MRLLSISDLYDPNNDWKPLLEHIAWLGTAYDGWKSKDTGGNRIVQVEMGDDTNRSPGLHASELNTCVRQAVYALNNVPRKIADGVDVNMKMRFTIGTAMHSVLQAEFEEVCAQTLGRVSFEPEVGISKDLGGVSAQYNISSSSDGVFTFCDDAGNPYLRLGMEIKTMSANEFDTSNKPKAQHIQQGTLYQRTLDLPLMWYLYYNKSNSNWTRPAAPWVVPYDKNEWSKTEARAVQAHAHVQAGTYPEREEGMPCKWCAFSDTCNPTILKLHSTYRRGKNKPRKVSRTR